MGMFDYITCEYPLAETTVQDEQFQTKSLDSELDRYIIGADGYLYFYQWNDDMSARRKRYDYHGDIIFYTGIGDTKDWDSPDHWYEYRARFTEGRLVSIVRILPEATQ